MGNSKWYVTYVTTSFILLREGEREREREGERER
jgi:hypothetical protein